MQLKRTEKPTTRDLLEEVATFPFIQALVGRRARRFSLGAHLPDGPLAFESKEAPVPLTRLEQLLVLSAAGGNTGWHGMITRNARYAPHLANYSGSASGRTFPSAAGIHTTELFFTDDEGIWFLPTRDALPPENGPIEDVDDLESWLQRTEARLHRLSEERLHIPAAEPFMEGHNTWCANRPGTTLIIPIGDVAQHMIALLCFLVQNGYCISDDVNRTAIPGLERFKHRVDLEHPYPLTFMEQYALTELTAELSTSCFAGMLMLQALGLGGWMFDGIDRHAIFGASGDPSVPGLGFRYDEDSRWSLPNPTGRPGVFEAFCPPHHRDMRAAVEAFAQRKFGPGGPFHPDTPGPWKDSRKVRSSAQVHDEEFKDCVSTMAQYIFDRFGKFPGTVPSVFALTYLQAQHLDLAFYDHHFEPGFYLQTHRDHMERWHRG